MRARLADSEQVNASARALRGIFVPRRVLIGSGSRRGSTGGSTAAQSWQTSSILRGGVGQPLMSSAPTRVVLESFDAALRVDDDVESLEDVDVRVRGAVAMTGESDASCMAVKRGRKCWCSSLPGVGSGGKVGFQTTHQMGKSKRIPFVSGEQETS